MRRAPLRGYHSKDSADTSTDSDTVGATLTIVKVAAWSLTKRPTGSVQAAMPSR